MAPIKAFDIDRLDSADLPAALALSSEAGWNQSADDWRVFLEQGQVFSIRDDGRVVATAAILPSGDFAWISMVLVTASHRQRGLGTLLLRHCIAELQRMGCTPYLDATPAGEQIYLPLGFQPVMNITRWQGRGAELTVPASRAELDACLVRDTMAFGARREPLLRAFLSSVPELAIRSDNGFVAARSGRLAIQIGPLGADSEAEALALLRIALDRATGPVFLDVPDRWTLLGEELKSRGFTVQRGFRRMALNTSTPNGDPDQSFVLAGPEFG
ncbi:MAG: GNAT family N-acetyltransferase [Alphaproteobacteria bacterium]|nr:GNAT family N-acetyltransferase [Alphaproteobacteria bacterium]